MKILSGSLVAAKIADEVSCASKRLHAKGITPTLAAILIGNDPASLIYVNAKRKLAKKLGIDFLLYRLPDSTLGEDVERLLADLHLDKSIHAILIQLPLPPRMDIRKLCAFIDPEKDIENFTGQSCFIPPTPQAVITLMDYYDIDYRKKKIGIIGQGFLVGRPLSGILRQSGAVVEVYDKDTQDVASRAAETDILICAAGCPLFVNSRFTNTHQVVIDVGNARGGTKKELMGDVNLEDIGDGVKAVTPRIGGVGPVTVALLMKNVIIAAEKQQQ